MKSCQELLAEIREKVMSAKEQLICEKKNLYKVDEMFTVEREKWAKEIKAEQVKIHLNEKELKKKEAKLETLKAEYEEKLKKCTELENENERLKKEIQKTKKQKLGGKQLTEIAKLEKILSRIQERQKDIKISSNWVKVFQEKDAKIQDMDDENKLKDEIQHLSDE